MTSRAEILETARAAVTVDRAATHGDLEDNFAMIAALWSARLGVVVTPAQVAILMVDLKTARAWGNPTHADSWVDVAGYAACGGELAMRRAEPHPARHIDDAGKPYRSIAEQLPDMRAVRAADAVTEKG